MRQKGVVAAGKQFVRAIDCAQHNSVAPLILPILPLIFGQPAFHRLHTGQNAQPFPQSGFIGVSEIAPIMCAFALAQFETEIESAPGLRAVHKRSRAYGISTRER